jgi:exodeoxyribonuclease-3
MGLRITTWNVNSVRLRAEQVARFVAEQAPDVLCMQEIKCQASEFPVRAFEDAGLHHLAIIGQKGWHGVAIASRLPLEPVQSLTLCREGHARVVSANVAGIEIHNLYIPAGGDVPDRTLNAKFDHKLDFFGRLTAAMSSRDKRSPLILAGDFNVAPGEFDVWNHRFMSKVVSHTPIEVAAMAALRASLDFIDPIRAGMPEPQKLASWWSYRAEDFRASNRGLRLDHLWLTPGLRDAALRKGAGPGQIHEHVRAWDRPSDHAPVSVDLAL